VGAAEGNEDGVGEGKAVGEQAAGVPSASGSNMGFSGLHSSAQQVQLTGLSARVLHKVSSGLQLAGRLGSASSKKQFAMLFSLHIVITSSHGVGAIDGAGEGKGVGEQTGGDPSGAIENMGFSGLHSSAQQVQLTGLSARVLHTVSSASQLTGRLGSSSSRKQFAMLSTMHVSSNSSQGVGDIEGTIVGEGDGIGVGAPQSSGLMLTHSSGQQVGHKIGKGSTLH
jgi:hypothetical protein